LIILATNINQQTHLGKSVIFLAEVIAVVINMCPREQIPYTLLSQGQRSSSDVTETQTL